MSLFLVTGDCHDLPPPVVHRPRHVACRRVAAAAVGGAARPKPRFRADARRSRPGAAVMSAATSANPAAAFYAPPAAPLVGAALRLAHRWSPALAPRLALQLFFTPLPGKEQA